MSFDKGDRFFFRAFFLKFDHQSAAPREILKDLFKSRYPLPATGVKRPEFGKRLPRNGSFTIRGPVDRPIVDDDQAAVKTLPHIELYHPSPHVQGPAERAKSIFRFVMTRATVRDEEEVFFEKIFHGIRGNYLNRSWAGSLISSSELPSPRM